MTIPGVEDQKGDIVTPLVTITRPSWVPVVNFAGSDVTPILSHASIHIDYIDQQYWCIDREVTLEETHGGPNCDLTKLSKRGMRVDNLSANWPEAIGPLKEALIEQYKAGFIIVFDIQRFDQYRPNAPLMIFDDTYLIEGDYQYSYNTYLSAYVGFSQNALGVISMYGARHVGSDQNAFRMTVPGDLVDGSYGFPAVLNAQNQYAFWVGQKLANQIKTLDPLVLHLNATYATSTNKSEPVFNQAPMYAEGDTVVHENLKITKIMMYGEPRYEDYNYGETHVRGFTVWPMQMYRPYYDLDFYYNPNYGALAEAGLGPNATFDHVVFQCSFNGADGTATAVDKSKYVNNPNDWRGGTQLDTAFKKFGTASLLNPADGYCGVFTPQIPQYYLQREFCIEFFVYFPVSPTYTVLVSLWKQDMGNQYWGSWMVRYGSLIGQGGAQSIDFVWSPDGNLAYSVGQAVSLLNSTWYHVAVERDGADNLRFFINGVMVKKVKNYVYPFYEFTQAGSKVVKLGIGGIDTTVAGNTTSLCQVDEVRITNGAVQYGSDTSFTPPTMEFSVPPPVITAPTAVQVNELSNLSILITSSKIVTWAAIGGDDAGEFEFSTASGTSTVLRWWSNGTKNFEAPDDFNADNLYHITVRGTDTNGVVSNAIAIAVQVLDLDETPGDVLIEIGDNLIMEDGSLIKREQS